MLFPFCCALLKAQTQNTTTIIETTTEDLSTKVEKIYKTHYKAPYSYSYSGVRNPCRVFIGVGTSPENGGLKVDYTIDDTPASTYGLKVGDIILSLDNVAVSSHTELTRERDKHQQGEAFTLNILRDGQKMNIKARFKECSQEQLEDVRREQENMRPIPILGVYEDKDASQGQGLVVGEVIPGKGAATAGLQSGDVITNVDGQSVYAIGGLQEALVGRKPGETVTVVYTRDGQAQQSEVTLSGNRNYFHQSLRRDPCAVFIGVYTSDRGATEKGVSVTGVIAGTPAKESNIQLGDVILALDGQPVNNFTELHQERDKHQPGDKFQLTILRGGSTQTINATFKACPKAGEVPKPEVVETVPVKQRDNSIASLETDLQVALDLYPNPTADVLTVRFEAEAIPTTVRVADASGKVVYSNVMNRFAGAFNEQISLADQKPGIYTLTVQQGKKIVSKNIVLVARN